MLQRLSLIQGDITHQAVDAIVNAANNSLLGGGGVDGAIHQAAGPELLEECRTLGGCETGKAKITKGYKLHAKYIIHTVGPIWEGGTHREDALLARCYSSCFAIGRTFNITTIAFPSISTGAFQFPIEQASRIALQEVLRELETNLTLDRVTIVCFDKRTFETYQFMEKEFTSNKG